MAACEVVVLQGVKLSVSSQSANCQTTQAGMKGLPCELVKDYTLRHPSERRSSSLLSHLVPITSWDLNAFCRPSSDICQCLYTVLWFRHLLWQYNFHVEMILFWAVRIEMMKGINTLSCFFESLVFRHFLCEHFNTVNK